MALWSLACPWPRPDGGRQTLLDYQVPLKAVQKDPGIGKIDLLGVTDEGRLVVVELKFPRNGNRGDSPMHALMEGLRYAAIVQDRSERLAKEIENRRGRQIDHRMPPIVQLWGPRSWWCAWLDHDLKRRATGDWNRAFERLASTLANKIGVAAECVATDTHFRGAEAGLRASRPTLGRTPSLYEVRLDPPGLDSLPPPESRA